MYNASQLRLLFQSKFNLQDWNKFVLDVIKPQTYRQKPEQLDINPAEGQGYFLGQKHTTDNFDIALFYLRLNRSVTRRRVGLRQLLAKYLRFTADAALVVFDDGDNWRLSFICDLKDERTQPKRYMFVFGEQNNYYNTAVKRFGDLQGQGITFETLKDAFSVEALTKEFYNELFGWYQWAVSPDGGIYFPNDTAIAEDDFEDKDKKIIRLLTRLMFVWFIKQKDLVPSKLFNEKQLQSILKDFDPQATDNGNYYNAILQNLFFATLNRAIEDDEGKRGFAKLQGQRDVKTLYRYAEMFRISEDEVLQLFAEVPFLNGGLFECLDKTKKIDGVDKAFNYDGFSRNANRWPNGRYRQRAFIPNIFFFDEEKGLLNILKRYNFTIEENTPNEQTVALDPELLGKVFENLLGAYNPETKETARNQSGSFYTPREIVNYMVDESLKAYLKDYSTEIIDEIMSDTFEYKHEHQSQYSSIANKLKQIKILDPACGSGAFPMGLLNRMVDILQKIEPEQSVYDLKLSIIENCIYGSDIQTIATQISKLRFFISLICDCEKDETKPNFGIPTLPNLETKFVTANSLIPRKNKGIEVQGNLFIDSEIKEIKEQLFDIRHKHFRAKTASEKIRLRKADEQLRANLAELLSQGFQSDLGADQLSKWNPYDQNAVADFFDAEWMFGLADGFDIVIGNPPYIQLQKSTGQKGKDKKGKEFDMKFADLYVDCNFETFDRTGDIYCLFYERGHQLLRQGGHLCYITSNKWMRAGYGESTRQFFVSKTDPQLLIDFAGVKIFESATVDTNILLFEKAENKGRTICSVTKDKDKDHINKLSDFVKSHSVICEFRGASSWVILSAIEKSIKDKIEAVGTPLREWDININRGVLTGYNEAFIIDTYKRNEILSACTTDDERQRTSDLIRPILRGRDIKRFEYEWAELWLIATFPAKHYNIEQYPAVKQYLLSFAKDELLNAGYDWIVKDHLADYCKQKLSQTGKFVEIKGKRITLGTSPEKARKLTNNKWFETQDSISYWDDFNKPKILWKRVGSILRFSYDESGKLGLDSTCFATGKGIAYLCCVLNSPMGHFLLKDAPKTGTGDLLISVQAVEPIKIPIIDNDSEYISYLHRFEQTDEEAERIINAHIYELYHLTAEEIEYLENREK